MWINIAGLIFTLAATILFIVIARRKLWKSYPWIIVALFVLWLGIVLQAVGNIYCCN